jgi:hypothetical protein
VTEETCYAAAEAQTTYANDSKLACVAKESGVCDDMEAMRCRFYQQVMEAGAQPDDWEPRTCGENTADWAGLVMWDVDFGNTWEDDIADCANPEAEEEGDEEDDEEDDEEESATGVSAGVATLAIAFALNM